MRPEAEGEFQEGLNAPDASGPDPAPLAEGGDHLPRRCYTDKLPFLKSVIT